QTVKEAEAERFSQQTAQAGGESKSQSVTKSRSSEARPAETRPEEVRPEELKPAEAPVEKLAKSPAASLETPQPQTPLSSPYTSTIPAEAAPVPVGSMVVELVATEPTWVQLSSGGKTVYIGTLDPAERRQFSVDENAKLLTGNAGTLDLKLNGKDVGTIGPRGQIRTVVFANSSFQIASPKTAHPPAFEGTPSTPTVAKRPTTVDR
ncbi:MAG: DUF4115 domain-containing protein, partial [Bryobacteraceae bacterium]|nr:DUF4115 domain-containing protein [Bryobacteraceae bacterium]